MIRAPAYLSPWLLWSDLAYKTGEMMLASASVVSHRTGRMANASIPPSASDQKEFQLMGQEKMEAVQESAIAGGKAMMTLGPDVMMKAFSQLWAVSGDMMSLAMSTSPAQVFARQSKLSRTLMSQSSTELSDAAARVTGKMMAPLHSRATANAKQLNRLK